MTVYHIFNPANRERHSIHKTTTCEEMANKIKEQLTNIFEMEFRILEEVIENA